MAGLGILLRMIGGREGPSLQATLLSGLHHPTAQMTTELRRLAQLALSDPTMAALLRNAEHTRTTLADVEDAQAFLAALRDFLDRFGARTGMLLPAPSIPAWEDDPGMVLSLVSLALRRPQVAEEEMTPPKHRQFTEAMEQVANLASRFPLGLIGIPRLVRFLTIRSRAMMAERDWVVFAYEVASRPIRLSMLESGERLAIRGILSRPKDIRFLSFEEVTEVLLNQPTEDFGKELRCRARRRKLARMKSQAHWRGRSFPGQSRLGGNVVLKGEGVSPGVASGIARVVLSEADFGQLNVGEILVCRAADPSWTPLFSLASALVADNGGVLSHAAIVAREYGIPAVLGTKFATTTLADGGVYTVDGTEGSVRTF